MPYIAIKSYNQYQTQVESFNKFNDKENDVRTKIVTDNDVIVVVIGESASSKHLGLYGYKRDTTPRLDFLSDSLIIYKNVISSHVFTSGSIFDILTLSNYENPKESSSLIGFVKNAGFEVSWLSNQRPVGFHDNLVSRLASEADESLFF